MPVVVSILCALLLSACAHAEDLRVLFVGNSLTFTNNLPAMTEQIARSLGSKPRLRADFAGRGGATLRDLWNDGVARRLIRERRYAFVVLQAQSSEVIRMPQETAEYARLFDTDIRRTGAKTVIFMTWAPREFDVPQATYDRVYVAIIRELNAVAAPVAAAWQDAERERIPLFADGVHPNPSGTYLAACVFYSVFYNLPATGAEHGAVDARTAETIQRLAWSAVSRHEF